MRTLTTQETSMFATGAVPPPLVRLRVQDSGGSWQDLTALYSQDWVVSVDLNITVDSPVDELRISAQRQSYNDSLAPLRTDTRPNLTTGSYAALVLPGRQVDFAVACIPQGPAPVSGDWRTIFQGEIEDVDAGVDPLTFTARDLGVRLQNLFIEVETVYSPASDQALETVMQAVIKDAHGIAWTAATVKAVRDRVTPTTQNGYWYRATAVTSDDKTHATTEPTWPTTIGNTVTDNHVTWTCEGICPTLYTPSSPGFTIKAYQQKRESVMDALKALATNNIGWEVRYRFRASSGNFELTLYTPNRSNTTADYTWDAGRYMNVQQHVIDRQDIRSAVQVVYSDSADLDLTGLPKRKTVRVEDTASMDTYSAGLPRFMELAEAATSQVDTSGEATTLANAALADCKDPTLQQTVELPFFYAVETGDLLGFTADNLLYTADQKLAVVAINHHLAAGEVPQTVVGVRGKPSLGARRWIAIEARPGGARPAPLSGPGAPTAVTVTPVQGGGAITFTPPLSSVAGRFGAGMPLPHAYETHVSESSGFTPDVTSLKGRGALTRADVGDLKPGTTYYAKVVPVDEKGNRGTASAQQSFTAGYTTPAAMQPQIAFGAFPPNPDFEGNNGGSAPPDTWSMKTGTWGTDATIDTSTVYSGGVSLRFISTTVNTEVQSQLFVVLSGTKLTLRAVLRCTTLPNTLDGLVVALRVYSDLGVTEVGTSPYTSVVWVKDINATANVWSAQTYTPDSLVDAAAKYARVIISKTAFSHAFECFIDSVSVSPASLMQEKAHTVSSFANSWVQHLNAPQYWLDANGNVHLTGSIKSGTIGGAAFTLPSGWRPFQNAIFSIVSNSAFGAVSIETNGNVTPVDGSNASVFLDGITFETRSLTSTDA